MSLFVTGLVLVGFLGLTLYISILAYSLRAYSRARLSERLTTDRQRRRLDWLDKNESQIQVVASFSRLVCNLAFITTMIFWYHEGSDELIRVDTLLPPALIALVILLFVNISVSHAFAAHAGEAVLAKSFGFLAILRLLFWPVVQASVGIEFVVRRLLGKSQATPEEETERLEEEILDAVSEGKAHGAVDEEQEDMIEAVFSLHETAVSTIMTPRTDIIAIDVDMPLNDVREIVTNAGHSRIPVIQDSLDQIEGVLYVKDLVRLKADSEYDVRKMMRKVPYVPETKTIDELLREFQQSKIHLAIVLDEYGGTAGLITIEDILEELVGEIDDEYDKATPSPITHLDDDTLDVDGRVHVSEINDELDLDEEAGIPEDGDYETISGFVFAKLGKIPTEGEEVSYQNIQIRVMSAEARKINRLRIHVNRTEGQSAKSA